MLGLHTCACLPWAFNNITHAFCPGLQKYGWEAHDGQRYGRQELYDGKIHITTFLKKRFCEVCAHCTRPDKLLKAFLMEVRSATANFAYDDPHINDGVLPRSSDCSCPTCQDMSDLSYDRQDRAYHAYRDALEGIGQSGCKLQQLRGRRMLKARSLSKSSSAPPCCSTLQMKG